MMTESGLFTIGELICKGDQDPSHNAIESPGSIPLTYRDLCMQIYSVVRALNAQGFHRNDRIAIIIPAGPEAAVSIVSVMAGFTVVPLNPQYKEREFRDIFLQLGIKAIIVQKDRHTDAAKVASSLNIPVIELIPVPHTAGKFELSWAGVPDTKKAEFATPADIAYVILTSGTISTSKIVPITQKQSAISRQRMRIASRITAADRCLHTIPYYHGMGIGTSLLVPLIAGGTVICAREFIPSDFPDILRTFKPTIYAAGPALLAGILRELKRNPSEESANNSLRYIRTGSGFLPAHVRRELELLLKVPLIDAYGMSEAGSIAINLPQKEGSVGIPIIDSMQITDQDGHPLKTNSTGEILIKGEAVFYGYENAPADNGEAFINGWFRTGDLGYLDDEGYLFLTGRKKELINKGGEKISPEEIDTVLRSHPWVKDAMTFGIADPVLGEDVAALIVPADDNLTKNDLHPFLLDRLIQFKIPRKIWFVDEIPRTSTGKPHRSAGTQKYSGKSKEY